jgi:Tol biopolymer transport system component
VVFARWVRATTDDRSAGNDDHRVVGSFQHVRNRLSRLSMAARVVVAVAGVGAALALTAPSAGATLVYSTGGFSSAANPGPQWIWSARDNGTRSRRLARGAAPSVSPNGRLVAYWSLSGIDIRLAVVPAAGGKSRVILHHWSDPATLGWSPDSRTIAAATGTVGSRRLVIVDVRSGKLLRTVATGFDFAGIQFSPDGSRVVYARVADARGSSDVYIAEVQGGAPVPLTRDHHSAWALWGPRWIVLSRSRKPPRPDDVRKLDLYLIKPSGAGLHRLTSTQPGPSLAGLRAVAWSANGTRLLAEMTGNDVTFAETVDPATGAVRRVGTPAQGLIGYALSRDGAAILATNGGPMPKDSDVVSVPYTYTGGKCYHVLVRHAADPDWNAAGAPR